MFATGKILLPLLILTAWILSDGLAAGSEPSGTAQAVAELIQQLNDDAYARREEACRRLTEMGKAALPALASAALQRNVEVRARAFAVLKALSGSDDEALRDDTRRVLKQIASQRAAAEKNNDETLASAAETASTILGRPFIGLFGMGSENATIGGVVKASPAEKAGCRAGDVVLALGDVATPTFQALIAAVGKKEPGDRAQLQIEREGKKMTLELMVGRYEGWPLEAVPDEMWSELEN